MRGKSFTTLINLSFTFIYIINAFIASSIHHLGIFRAAFRQIKSIILDRLNDHFRHIWIDFYIVKEFKHRYFISESQCNKSKLKATYERNS